jgi:hypothetical protein
MYLQIEPHIQHARPASPFPCSDRRSHEVNHSGPPLSPVPHPATSINKLTKPTDGETCDPLTPKARKPTLHPSICTVTRLLAVLVVLTCRLRCRHRCRQLAPRANSNSPSPSRSLLHIPPLFSRSGPERRGGTINDLAHASCFRSRFAYDGRTTGPPMRTAPVRRYADNSSTQRA